MDKFEKDKTGMKYIAYSLPVLITAVAIREEDQEMQVAKLIRRYREDCSNNSAYTNATVEVYNFQKNMETTLLEFLEPKIQKEISEVQDEMDWQDDDIKHSDSDYEEEFKQ